MSKHESEVYEAAQRVLETLSRISRDGHPGFFPHGITLIDLGRSWR